jgi:hypothetical protein
MDENVLSAAVQAFYETIELKLHQFRRVVPKGSNAALTGAFVGELVRGFIRAWISPSLLMHGTLYPHETYKLLPPGPSPPPDQCSPKQVDGIVYDPRLGPAIIQEGSFLVTHPAFCRGIIEIKTSEPDLKDFESRLKALHWQYLVGCSYTGPQAVMGIVIQDSNPDRHPCPRLLDGAFPIFLLFKELEGEYEPNLPMIETMIRTVFRNAQMSVSCSL